MEENFGNKLYQIIFAARAALFRQSEQANLAYIAYEIALSHLSDEAREPLEITYPVGWNADNTPIHSQPRKYSKESLLTHYRVLAQDELALNGLFRLVAIVETMLGDLVRAVVLKYPEKLGKKRTIDIAIVLGSASIEEIHLKATDTLLHELFYKSPRDFACDVESLLSCNLLECPAYHKYIEIKATRDIHIHNRGLANEVYRVKAGSHSRVRSNTQLYLADDLRTPTVAGLG